ncbi:entericidin A/B family lipoprotein [Psychrobacter sp. I-STPA6b]|nr:entericidin A/B family lipoprotein [Psychrobacter sp. I-STPA6b]
MKKVILASLAAMIVLTGCNTFKGMGKDISNAGNDVTKAAEDVEERL